MNSEGLETDFWCEVLGRIQGRNRPSAGLPAGQPQNPATTRVGFFFGGGFLSKQQTTISPQPSASTLLRFRQARTHSLATDTILWILISAILTMSVIAIGILMNLRTNQVMKIRFPNAPMSVPPPPRAFRSSAKGRMR